MLIISDMKLTVDDIALLLDVYRGKTLKQNDPNLSRLMEKGLVLKMNVEDNSLFNGYSLTTLGNKLIERIRITTEMVMVNNY